MAYFLELYPMCLVLVILYFIFHCKAELKCGIQSPVDNGQIFENRIDEFYTMQPSEKYSNITVLKCALMFTASSELLSMNIIPVNDSKVSCQMFEKKATEDNGNEAMLIKKPGSAYYEKIEDYKCGIESVVVVESKDDKPGTFIFNQPTACYTIKLNHVSGKLNCFSGRRGDKYPTNFGCRWFSSYKAVDIILVKGFRGEIIVEGSDFTQYDVDWIRTSHVTTSKCSHLTEGELYSFWYQSDFDDHVERTNFGKITFEFLVKRCKCSQ